MLSVSEMAKLLGCSESRLVRNTKYYMEKINSLGYEKVGRGKSMMFGEIETSAEKEAYMRLLELLEGDDTTLNNMLDMIGEIIDMAGLERDIKNGNKEYIDSDVEILSNSLGWSNTKTKDYLKLLQEVEMLRKVNPKYFGVKHNGELEEISFETYTMINEQIQKAIEGSKNVQFVRELVLSVHGYKNIRKIHGWTFTDKALQSEEFMRDILLALEYRKKMRKS